MTEYFLPLRIVHRDERALAELAREQVEPEAADAHRNRDVQPVDREAALAERRTGQPDEVGPAHHEDEGRDRRKRLALLLHAARKQDQEGKEEMEDQDAGGDVTPAAVEAHLEPD